MQAAVVVNQHHVNAPDLVDGAVEPEDGTLLALVLLVVQAHQPNVLGAHEDDLALVEGVPVVTRPVVDVALRDVVELVHVGVQDGVALLHGRVAHDAELLDERLRQVVVAHVGVAGEDGDVAGHAVRAKHLEVEGAVRLDRGGLFLAKLRQVQQGLLGRDHLVAAVELVQDQVLQLGGTGQKGKVDVAQLELEVAQLGRQMHGLVVERACAADPGVGVQDGGAQVLRDALLDLVDWPDGVALRQDFCEARAFEDAVLELAAHLHQRQGVLVSPCAVSNHGRDPGGVCVCVCRGVDTHLCHHSHRPVVCNVPAHVRVFARKVVDGVPGGRPAGRVVVEHNKNPAVGGEAEREILERPRPVRCNLNQLGVGTRVAEGAGEVSDLDLKHVPDCQALLKVLPVCLVDGSPVLFHAEGHDCERQLCCCVCVLGLCRRGEICDVRVHPRKVLAAVAAVLYVAQHVELVGNGRVGRTLQSRSGDVPVELKLCIVHVPARPARDAGGLVLVVLGDVQGVVVKPGAADAWLELVEAVGLDQPLLAVWNHPRLRNGGCRFAHGIGDG